MELKAKKREIAGKKVTELRRQGLIPGVVYGNGIEATPLTVTSKEFDRCFKVAGESSLVTLSVEGESKPRNVLIYDISQDFRTNAVAHVDFYQVRMDEKIKAKVQLEFIGTSLSEKEGNTLVKNIHEIEVEALPSDLPSGVQIDLSALKTLEDRITLGSINLGLSVKILGDLTNVIAMTVPPRSEAELEDLKQAPVATDDISTIKTEGQEKKEAKEAAEKAAKEAEEKK